MCVKLSHMRVRQIVKWKGETLLIASKSLNNLNMRNWNLFRRIFFVPCSCFQRATSRKPSTKNHHTSDEIIVGLSWFSSALPNCRSQTSCKQIKHKSLSIVRTKESILWIVRFLMIVIEKAINNAIRTANDVSQWHSTA